jgi:hypothetical protein
MPSMPQASPRSDTDGVNVPAIPSAPPTPSPIEARTLSDLSFILPLPKSMPANLPFIAGQAKGRTDGVGDKPLFVVTLSIPHPRRRNATEGLKWSSRLLSASSAVRDRVGNAGAPQHTLRPRRIIPIYIFSGDFSGRFQSNSALHISLPCGGKCSDPHDPARCKPEQQPRHEANQTSPIGAHHSFRDPDEMFKLTGRSC